MGINISHVNIENMGGRDQSQVKIKFKKFEKVKSVPKDVPKSHNDDTHKKPLAEWTKNSQLMECVTPPHTPSLNMVCCFSSPSTCPTYFYRQMTRL